MLCCCFYLQYFLFSKITWHITLINKKNKQKIISSNFISYRLVFFKNEVIKYTYNNSEGINYIYSYESSYFVQWYTINVCRGHLIVEIDIVMERTIIHNYNVIKSRDNYNFVWHNHRVHVYIVKVNITRVIVWLDMTIQLIVFLTQCVKFSRILYSIMIVYD